MHHIETIGQIVNILLGISCILFLAAIAYATVNEKLNKRKKIKNIKELGILGPDETITSVENYDTDKLLQMQTDLLIYTSDAIHNIGNPIFAINGDIESAIFKKNIVSVCADIKQYSKNIQHGYNPENYSKILHFIKRDFHDYCHYIIPELDMEKWKSLKNKKL